MITQCNTKLFFSISDLKILRWKILLRVKSDPLLLSRESELTCVCRVSGQSPPTICCQPPPPLLSLCHLISAPAIIEVKLVFIGVNGAVTDGSPAVSKGQLEICHLTQPDICPSTRNWNLSLHRIIYVILSLMHNPTVYCFLYNLAQKGKEPSQNHVTIFGKLN